ncbi:MAG: hypothetical protein JW860_05635 [Sedimentisphaerales bacterium]|nr:hypothetical protein [Sedimentisphaerales bacterium]
MNRLFRRIRRSRKVRGYLDQLTSKKGPQSRSLVVESLENRLLLTTLTLPKGETNELIYRYADPEENEAGAEDITAFNEIRIGTLSGMGPSKDVVVELLDENGENIGGDGAIGTDVFRLFGGPGGGPIIDEIPSNTVGGLGVSINALATNSSGMTYGLTANGYLVRLDISTGEIASVIGQIRDTDSPLTSYEIAYTGFESATFSRNASGQDVLYAVVTSPTAWNLLGQPVTGSYESVLITIDVDRTFVNQVPIAEAEPVGKDSFGQSNYEMSQVRFNGLVTDISTIVFSEEPGDNPSVSTDEPVFLGYDISTTTFISLNVQRAPGTNMVTILTQEVAQVTEEDVIVAGMMYDNQGRLFGLRHTGDAEGEINDGTLVIINLYAPADERFTDVVEYGTVLIGGDEVDIVLTGLTFDSLNDMGFASDANTGTLYQVNVARLVPSVDNADEFIVEGMVDIYMVYIAQSTPDVYITFTRVDVTEDDITYTPTSGETAYLFMDEEDSEIYTPDEAGGVMIGTNLGFIPNEDELHWVGSLSFFDSTVTAPDPGVKGAYPGGEFRPGIVVAPDEYGNPQDIGKIQVGGAVFGDVVISGSIDTFYAGYLATNRFIVNGDLNTLVVATEAGGRSGSDEFWTSVGTSYFYGGDGVFPVVDVGGQMGSFYCVGDWGLPVRVWGRDDAPKFPGVLDPSVSTPDAPIYVRMHREIERKLTDEPEGFFFPSGGMETGGAYIINNDSPYNAQYLGTVDGKLSVVGQLESVLSGEEDYYSFGVMAGQTIEVQMYYTAGLTNAITGHPLLPDSEIPLAYSIQGGLDLFDPELNWVGNLGEMDIVTGAPLPLTFTAEEAGIYTISVDGVFDEVKTSGFGYRLDISGVSETSLGGGNILADMRTSVYPLLYSQTDEFPEHIQVVNGNLGAISVGQYMRLGNIAVLDGSAAAIRAGANALELNDIDLRYYANSEDGDDLDITIDIPGDVPTLGFGYESDDLEDQNVAVASGFYISGDMGRVSSPVKSTLELTVGGDLQSFRIGNEIAAPEPLEEADDDEDDEEREEGSFSGYIAVNGNIGEIRIESAYLGSALDISGELDSTIYYNSFRTGIFANADGIGEEGVIDSIIVGDDFETIVSVGPLGGNVRFVDIRGGITHSSGGWTELGGFGPFTYDPGESVTIVDDSGALVKITPGYRGLVEDEIIVVPGEDPADGAGGAVGDGGGVLSVKLLPVLDILPEEVSGSVNRTELGYAIVEIESTDGLRISSSGGPAEIGVVSVTGVEDNTVSINGNYPVSVLRMTITAPVAAADGAQDEEAVQEFTGITRIVNSSGYWEHYFNGRWMEGRGPDERWRAGDIVSIQIGGDDAARNITLEDDGGGNNVVSITIDVTQDPATQEYPFDIIRIEGNLGYTYNSTGQIIKSLQLSAADANVYESVADPGGEQHNGLFSEVAIDRIIVGGALGDVDVRNSVNVIEINEDNSRYVNQYDGVIGTIIIYGNLNRIDLGDGIPHPGTGRFAEAGVFVYGLMGTVEITGQGRDMGGPVFAATSINQVLVSDGARITGYNGWGGTGERVRGSFYIQPTITVTLDFDDFFLEDSSSTGSGPINTIRVTGEDSEIRGAEIRSGTLGEFYVNNGAEGVFDSRIRTRGDYSSDNGFIQQMTVGGAGIHNTLIQATNDIENIVVQSGGTMEDCEIRSEYHIGNIIADEINRTDMDAINLIDKVTARDGIIDLAIETGELGQLKASDDILGSAIYVGGPINKISTPGNLISSIVITGPHGDLNNITVGGDFGTGSGGILSVDGEINSIKVGGDFEGQLRLNWEAPSSGFPEGRQKYYREGLELNKLSVKGSITGFGNIGGDIGTIQCGGEFGSQGDMLFVHGDMKKLVVGSGSNPANLQNDLTVDGEVGSVTVYGSIHGDIVVAEDFKSLTTKGNATYRGDINGDITVGGELGKLTIINGDLNGNLNVEGGLKKKIIKGSDITGTVIVNGAPDGFVIDGSITDTGRYISTDDVGVLHIKGDIERDAVLAVDGDLEALVVEGSILGQVHVTGSIGSIQAANVGGDSIVSTVTAGGDIGQINIDGIMRDSFILAGFDPGFEGTINAAEFDDSDPSGFFDITRFTVDGTISDPRERALAGNINTVTVEMLVNSVVAAGVSPGTNNVFGDLDGSDTAGSGLSVIKTVVIGGTSGDGSPFGVFSDTEINSLKVAGIRLPIPVSRSDGFRTWTLAALVPGSIEGRIFEAGRPYEDVIIDPETGNEVTIKVSMTGPGAGVVMLNSEVTGIDVIQLEDTTRSTSVKVVAAGKATVDVGRIFNGDDESLKSLTIDGELGGLDTDGYLLLGGSLDIIKVAGIGQGTEVTIEGPVKTADFGQMAGTYTYATTVDIQGGISKIQALDIDRYVTLTAGNVNSFTVKGDMGGSLQSQGTQIQNIQINGNMSGVISSDGDINTITVKGMMSGSVRAAWEIGRFTTDGMYLGVVAAGSDLVSAQVKGDMEYSTLAAGLDIGSGGNLYNPDEVSALQGDIKDISVRGNFLYSNISAGVAPGEDNMFGTGDDSLSTGAAERFAAPKVEDVTIRVDDSGVQFDTIDITFKAEDQGPGSNINNVRIKGIVAGTNQAQDHFAVIASGVIDTVIYRDQTFSGVDNIERLTVNRKDLVGSSIENDSIDTLSQALAASFIIQTDGEDHIFADFDEILAGTADDVVIFGGADDEVWIDYNPATRVASYHKANGFVVNTEATNYYKITLDAEQIMNRNGIALDGEFVGDWPSGNGEPGGDFEYYFAVGDLGDSGTTAFTPIVGEFPDNKVWEFSSILGDNRGYSATEALLETDTVRINGLSQGQILNVNIKDNAAIANPWWISASGIDTALELMVYQIEDSNLVFSSSVDTIEYGGRADLNPERDLVVPDLDELAYSGGMFYGYEDQGQQFISIDRATLGISLLPNTLDDLNALPEVVAEGSITHLQALAGHVGDSLWAIAEIQDNFNQDRRSLVLIKNISADDDSSVEPQMIISDYDIGQDYADMVGLAEFNGVLYGIDGASESLVILESDINDSEFGRASLVGNLGNDDLVIVGLDVSPEGDALLALHDQPYGQTDNLLVDALYRIDTSVGQANLWVELGEDWELGGLTAEPGGAILVGLPLRESPIGDTLEITYNEQTKEHVFGSSESTDFEGGGHLVITSDPTYVNSGENYNLLENDLQQEFIDGGFYYVFDITYSGQLGDIIIEMSDIDWLNETEYSNIVSVTSDDPDNVTIIITDANTIMMQINTTEGDGDVKVFFAGTGLLASLTRSDLDLAGEVQGAQARSDLTVRRDMIMPDLDELTIASEILDTGILLELTDSLRDALSEDIVEQIEDVGGLLDDDLYDDIVEELAAYANAEVLLNELDDSLGEIYFDAVGYDAQQELFALISSTSYFAMPIMVEDPNDPVEDVPLTLEILSDIYQVADTTVTFEDIRGLEFGLIDVDSDINELWAIVSVTQTNPNTGLSVSRDSLLRIGDILMPVGSMDLSINDLSSESFTDVTELALGNMPGKDADNGILYGLDNATHTLLRIDHHLWVPNESGIQISNMINFGTAVAVGQDTGNLTGNDSQSLDIVAMDFDGNGRLLAVDGESNILIEINTGVYISEGNSRIDLIQMLPTENDYRALGIDSTVYNGTILLARSVSGTPLDDAVQVSVTIGAGGVPVVGSHIFGSDTDTDVSSVVFSSLANNSTEEVAAEGGYYQLVIDYSAYQGQGQTLSVTISDINFGEEVNGNWVNRIGEVDAVALSDTDNVTLVGFDSQEISLEINSDNDIGSVIVYFGSTSDLQRPAGGQIAGSLTAYEYSYQGELDMMLQIPDDGDYLLELSVPSFIYIFTGIQFSWYETAPIKYDLSLLLFDDGNSDFGVTETTSGLPYDQIVPHNAAVDLNAGSNDLTEDPDVDELYYYNYDEWTFTVEGPLLVPGEAGEVVIDNVALHNFADTDVYSIQLMEGQWVTIDIDADVLFGRDTIVVDVGIYNGDLEVIATINGITDDALASQAMDPAYMAQAVYTMPNHAEVVIDPEVSGIGTYYIVVSGYAFEMLQGSMVFADSEVSIPYTLKISTSVPLPVDAPPSQLVWLSFGDYRNNTNAVADYLLDGLVDIYGSPDVIYRPPFSAEDFDLKESLRDELIQDIKARIEQMYFHAGLDVVGLDDQGNPDPGEVEGEIKFVLEKPAFGQVYSTVIFGGELPYPGLLGLAEHLDRHNSDQTDMAVVLTETIGEELRYLFDEDEDIRYDEVVQAVAWTGAHELGHILGLEHATEINTNQPNNIMGYNYGVVFEDQEFEERTSYTLGWGPGSSPYQIGFQNEVDMLLRNIGSGTPIGE